MSSENHSLEIETKWFKATAKGWGLVTLLLMAVIVIGATAFGFG